MLIKESKLRQIIKAVIRESMGAAGMPPGGGMKLKIDFDRVYLSSLLNDAYYSWLNEVFEEYINEDPIQNKSAYADLFYHLFNENCCGDISVIDLETGEDLSEELYGKLTAEQLNKLFDEIVEFYKSGSWKV